LYRFHIDHTWFYELGNMQNAQSTTSHAPGSWAVE
jgi:hypothetical protein